jgi:hypothetical protein
MKYLTFFFLLISICKLNQGAVQQATCEYSYCNDPYCVSYICVVNNLMVADGDSVSIVGTGLGDASVTDVRIVNSNLAFIPPEFFTKFTNLRNIFAQTSKLPKLLKLNNCANLRTLDVADNLLTELTYNMVSSCTNLQVINADLNRITSLEPNLFQNLLQLRLASFLNNNIQRLKLGALYGNSNPNLQIYLDNNPITVIEGNLRNVNYKHISLVNCRINAIDPTFFNGYTSTISNGIDLDINICVSKTYLIVDSTNINLIKNNLAQCFANFANNTTPITTPLPPTTPRPTPNPITCSLNSTTKLNCNSNPNQGYFVCSTFDYMSNYQIQLTA